MNITVASETEKEVIVPVAVTLPIGLLKAIDERARELDLNRSQYFRRLVRADLIEASLSTPTPQPEKAEVGA